MAIRDDRYLTVAELAQRWRQSAAHIRRTYTKLGLVPIRIGPRGRLLFALDAVEALERRQKEQAQSQ